MIESISSDDRQTCRFNRLLIFFRMDLFEKNKTSFHDSLAKMFFIIILTIVFLSTCHSCEIWKASECPPGPTKDDEELMKSELYTKEQLFAFCDAGKLYSDCVNERLHCCDMRVEYASALASLDAQLKRNAWRTSKYCVGITESNAIQYRCLTTSGLATSSTFPTTTTPIPICDVERVRTKEIFSLSIPRESLCLGWKRM